MESGAIRFLDPEIFRRGQFITVLIRWFALGASFLALAALWDNPRTQGLPCVLVALGYAACTLASQLWLRSHPQSRHVKQAQATVDALALGLGSGFSGGLESPVWLLLYPHVLAYSVRGGVPIAIAVGLLDAGIVVVLTLITPSPHQGFGHASAILLCASVGALTSSYLRSIQGRLYQANKELQSKNEQLSQTIAAQEAARREQELAIAQLRESEERYRRLLERIQDGILIIQEGRVAYANQVFAEMVGEAREALVGADFRDLVPPEDREDVVGRYQRWEESRARAGSFEGRLRTRRGEMLLVSVKAGSLDFEGRRSVIATIRDITRERRMEEDIKAHAERLAAINEIANAVNLNLTIEDIFGVAAEEARRLVPFDRLTIALIEEETPGVEVVAVEYKAQRHPATFTRDEVTWAFRRPFTWCHGGEDPPPPHVQGLLAEPGVLAVATVPLVSKERVIGSMNLGRLKAQPFATWDLGVLEPVARHIAIALDNARMLEAVRRRGREFESLFEIGRAIVGRLEVQELLPIVTRSVNRIMGTHFCLLMLRAGDTLSVGAHEGLEPEVVEAVEGLRVGESLTGWVAREGKPLLVLDMREEPRLRMNALVIRFGYRSYLCVPLMRGDEVLGTLEVVTKEPRLFSREERDLLAAFAGLAAVAIDNARLFAATRSHVAELAEANRRLEELDRLRQEYLRNVSHEFRTPLTVIKGYAEYVMDAGAHDEQALREVMKVIVESCDRVIDMVDTLIEVSRVEQGAAEQILQMQKLDLRDVAASSIDPLRYAAERKGIELSLELPGEPLSLQGDGGLLHQVVRKLVDNALKYSPHGERVVVRARAEGDELALEVEDHGIGIPPEHLSRIFEKFYMVDGGVARRVGGTGVGLYLVREIVRLHSGTVEVRSRPGKGSLFSVRLPRQPQRSRPQTALA